MTTVPSIGKFMAILRVLWTDERSNGSYRILYIEELKYFTKILLPRSKQNFLSRIRLFQINLISESSLHFQKSFQF